MKIILMVMSLLLAHVAFANTTINSIYFTDQGQGKALVLIHAFPADNHLWEPQVKALVSHYRVITVDLMGFGRSKPTHGEAITMNEYAQEVKTVLDQLKINKAIIGGESMGGYVSLAFLKRYPERTAGLILADTQAINDNEQQKAKRETAALDILKNGPQNFVMGFVPKAVSQNAQQSVKQFLTKMFLSQPATGMASALRGMAQREDNSKVLQNTNKPILIITGDLDEVISPKESENMHHLAKQSKLVVIHGAGHLTNIERPNEWNQSVLDFFKN